MTIKKYLTRSNMIMTLIPVMTTLAVIAVALLLYYGFTHLYYDEFHVVLKQIHTTLESYEAAHFSLEIIKYAVVIASGASVFLTCFYTNKFFSKYIIKKINMPLDMLIKGIDELNNGNLDYRIKYDCEDEFLEVCDALNNMAAKLKESQLKAAAEEKSRRETIAGISHDLRSPLTSIRAYTQALIDGVPKTPEKIDFHLQTIKKKEILIEKMVNELFFYTKLDLDDSPCFPERINAKEEIKKLALDIESDNFSVEVSGRDDVIIVADRETFARTVINIIENSKKYTDKENAQLNIFINKEDGKNKLVFHDNGSGVPENMLSDIFEVFFRVDSSRSSTVKGSGLGLSIVKKAVEKFGGNVYAENDNGLKITILIPDEVTNNV